MRVASRIEQESSQRRLAPASRRDIMRALFGETPLHSVEQCAINQRRLWARADLALIDDFTEVKTIAQNVEEGALGERHAATRVAVRQPTNLRPDVALTKFEHQPVDAAECEITLEDQADPVSFLFNN